MRRKGQTGEGKCRDPPGWRGPCEDGPRNMPIWEVEGGFSETLVRKPVKAPQAFRTKEKLLKTKNCSHSTATPVSTWLFCVPFIPVRDKESMT